MAFWGIEVKPGKPITHYCEKARGRLRISQATLGIGETRLGSEKGMESENQRKIIVQCNVGSRSPVFLCALLTNKTESCHLDLEFEEADDVIFSVIGPRSIYLTGYYVQRTRQLDPHSDTESYGMDIEHTHTEGSSYCSDDDNYEDSFINDDDELPVSPQSPVNNKGMDEATPENDKSKDRKGRGRQRRKKYRVIESDNDANSHESDDKDDYSLFVRKSERSVETTKSDAGEKIPQVTVELGDEAKDDGICGVEPKEKVDRLDISDKLEGVTKLLLDEEKTEARDEKIELLREVETLEENIVSNEKVLTGETIHENNAKDTVTNQSLPQSYGNDQMQSLDLVKSKKKRKKCSKKEKTCNIQTDNKDNSVLKEDKKHEVETSADMDISDNSEDGQKSKKRRNGLQLEGTNIEGTDVKCKNVLKDDKSEQGLQHADSLARDLPVANRENQEQQRLEEICTKEIGTECHDIPKEDKYVQVLPLTDGIEDLPAKRGEYQEQQIDNIVSVINKEILASDSQSKKKIKKKKKTQAERDLNMDMTNTTDSKETMLMEYEDHTAKNAAPVSKRTLSNGLIIEELASGPPDGKVAAPGKKVRIYYTAMLKETGHVFDSNSGKAAFKFQLGDEEYIDGWNVGIDGMRVGDKRRLIIPPSMGFGDHGMEENVPPNSWLVYDIELVGVRK